MARLTQVGFPPLILYLRKKTHLFLGGWCDGKRDGHGEMRKPPPGGAKRHVEEEELYTGEKNNEVNSSAQERSF